MSDYRPHRKDSIAIVRASGLTERALMRYMDALCFPNDTPYTEEGALWLIGTDWKAGNNTPACYCAWRFYNGFGFHYRAGVMPNYRGKGLQQTMLTLREEDMQFHKVSTAITYTDADGVASMNNLIKAGYRPYDPANSKYPFLAGKNSDGNNRIGRVGFVHWYKELV